MLQKLFRRTPPVQAQASDSDSESSLAEIDKQVKRLAKEV